MSSKSSKMDTKKNSKKYNNEILNEIAKEIYTNSIMDYDKIVVKNTNFKFCAKKKNSNYTILNDYSNFSAYPNTNYSNISL